MRTVYLKNTREYPDGDVNWMNLLTMEQAVEVQQIFEYEVGDIAWIEHPRYRWKEVTEERYEEMLDTVPPVGLCGYGFLVGEPMDHHPIRGVSRYTALVYFRDRFFESLEPMTRMEWNHLDLGTVIRNCVS